MQALATWAGQKLYRAQDAHGLMWAEEETVFVDRIAIDGAIDCSATAAV